MKTVLITLFLTTIAAAQPKYTGWVDIAGCNGIVGWAADLTRLNQAITVSLWEGSTVISSTLASTLRPDVGAAIHDKGAHGFSLSFPQDGIQHSLQLHFESSTALLGAPIVFKCGTPIIPPVVPEGLPVVREVPRGVTDGVNTVFTLSNVVNELFPILVFRNRQLVELGAFKVTGTMGPGSGITFVVAPVQGDILEVVYWNSWQTKQP